jgi:hypothetical protein
VLPAFTVTVATSVLAAAEPSKCPVQEHWSTKCGNTDSSQIYGNSRPIAGIILHFIFFFSTSQRALCGLETFLQAGILYPIYGCGLIRRKVTEDERAKIEHNFPLPLPLPLPRPSHSSSANWFYPLSLLPTPLSFTPWTGDINASAINCNRYHYNGIRYSWGFHDEACFYIGPHVQLQAMAVCSGPCCCLELSCQHSPAEMDTSLPIKAEFYCSCCDLVPLLIIRFKGTLRRTFSRPVCPSVRPPPGAVNSFFFSFSLNCV